MELGGETTAPERRGWFRGRASLVVVLGVILVALVMRLDTAAASFETYDERPWLTDSTRFWDNLSAGDLGGASAEPDGELGTLPGITTMWVGTAARGVWSIGADLGLWSGSDVESYGGGTTWASTRSGLNVAQVAMALATSLLAGLIVALLARWVGVLAAGIAGLLLATEPFIVAHGSVLHTDELMSLFGLAAVIAVALALGLPSRTAMAGRRSSAILAGVLFAGCFLTKVTGLMLLPTFALLAAWAVGEAWRTERSWPAALRPTAVTAAWAGLACLVTMLATYPALWAEPVEEVRSLKNAVMVGREGHIEYFLGEPTATPGPAFYSVVMPFRSTPWLLLLAVAAAIAVLVRPTTRRVGLVLLIGALFPFVSLSLAKQQHDRYGLILPMFAAVLVGIVAASLYDALTDTDRRKRRARLAGGIAGVAIVVHGLAVAPWGLAYYNPLLGGSSTAPDVMNVGWGEGLEAAGAMVRELEGGRCDDDLTVDGYGPFAAHFQCGHASAPDTKAKYQIAYIEESLVFPDSYAAKIEDRELVAEHRIRGLPYVRIYGPYEGDEVGTTDSATNDG